MSIDDYARDLSLTPVNLRTASERVERYPELHDLPLPLHELKSWRDRREVILSDVREMWGIKDPGDGDFNVSLGAKRILHNLEICTRELVIPLGEIPIATMANNVQCIDTKNVDKCEEVRGRSFEAARHAIISVAADTACKSRWIWTPECLHSLRTHSDLLTQRMRMDEDLEDLEELEERPFNEDRIPELLCTYLDTILPDERELNNWLRILARRDEFREDFYLLDFWRQGNFESAKEVQDNARRAYDQLTKGNKVRFDWWKRSNNTECAQDERSFRKMRTKLFSALRKAT